MGMSLPALVATAGTDGDHLALRGLFLDGIGNDDAAGGLRLGLDAFDDNAVMQRAEFHLYAPMFLAGEAVRAARTVRAACERNAMFLTSLGTGRRGFGYCQDDARGFERDDTGRTRTCAETRSI